MREMRFNCANDLVVLRICAGSIGCKKCALLAAVLLTHNINQGCANVFNIRVICRKPKTPKNLKTSLWGQYKYDREWKFYIK